MGKSTILTHLSKQMKQKFPAKWLVRIDLNDHTDALKDNTDALNALKQEQIDKEAAIQFVSQKLLKLKPGLEKELFKQCCEQKQKVRIVIMLDGFDEISPFYKQTVIGLLQALRQTAVEQLWVTTRPHLREELEDKLQQPSYTLEPFSEKDQVELLTKFWSLQDWFTEPNDEGEETEHNKLENYAENLIKNLAYLISDKDREFTGIPLQTRMLAEAFDKEVKAFYRSAEPNPEISNKLDLLALYERFTERKYDIYQEEKYQVNVKNVVAREQRKFVSKIMREDYQLLALKVLLTEEQVALFQNKSQCSFSTEELTRFGIVQVNHDGKPHFIHCTFAKYYVANYLVNRLREGNNTSEQLHTFILKDVLLEDKYRVIRVFVDGLLSRSKISNLVLNQYGNRIHDLREYGDKILHRAAFEDNANIIGFLLDSVRAGNHTDTVKELLLKRDEEGLTAWHTAVFYNSVLALEKIWEWAEKELTEEELKNEFLLARVEVNDIFNGIQERWGGRDPLLLWRTENTGEDLQSQNKNVVGTVWHVAANVGNLKVLKKLWEWAKKKLTKDEIKERVLFDTDKKGRNIWHLASRGGNLDKLRNIWEWAKEHLTKEDVKNKLLLSTDNEGMTAWHCASREGNLDILQKVLEWANENLTSEEVNNK